MTTQTPRRRVLWLLITLVAVLLVGVGVTVGLLLQRPAPVSVVFPDGSRLEDVVASQAAMPTCAQLFADGHTIDDAKARAGCRDTPGELRMGNYHVCKDGRALFTIDAPRGWGFGGDVFHETTGDVAGDAGFSQAYQACRS